MAKDTQKVVIASTCSIGPKVFHATAGYELPIETVKDLRGAGRVAAILKDDAKLPPEPGDKETATAKTAGKETATK